MAAAFITTSWDDGHPLDFRLAEMLARHGLRGTFYIPRSADSGVMPEARVRELARLVEVGAHTLRHVFLDTVNDDVARAEITGSKAWIEDVTGRPCPLFCPPGGKVLTRHIELIREAGFSATRTVELLSLDPPRRDGNMLLMPTTLQAHPHRLPAYLRNVLKRRAWRNLWLYLLHGHSTDWPRLLRNLLRHTVLHGGVFHLWGHSWEIEKHGQWDRLEQALQILSEFTSSAPCLTNAEVCTRFRD